MNKNAPSQNIRLPRTRAFEVYYNEKVIKLADYGIVKTLQYHLSLPFDYEKLEKTVADSTNSRRSSSALNIVSYSISTAMKISVRSTTMKFCSMQSLPRGISFN